MTEDVTTDMRHSTSTTICTGRSGCVRIHPAFVEKYRVSVPRAAFARIHSRRTCGAAHRMATGRPASVRDAAQLLGMAWTTVAAHEWRQNRISKAAAATYASGACGDHAEWLRTGAAHFRLPGCRREAPCRARPAAQYVRGPCTRSFPAMLVATATLRSPKVSA